MPFSPFGHQPQPQLLLHCQAVIYFLHPTPLHLIHSLPFLLFTIIVFTSSISISFLYNPVPSPSIHVLTCGLHYSTVAGRRHSISHSIPFTGTATFFLSHNPHHTSSHSTVPSQSFTSYCLVCLLSLISCSYRPAVFPWAARRTSPCVFKKHYRFTPTTIPSPHLTGD
jgi:hypothetical protein